MAIGIDNLSQKKREQLGFNPDRTYDLFALTDDGYIIAQDIACQHEFVLNERTEEGHPLLPIAHINRSFQGLSEIVALCPVTGEHMSFIFDISNDVYQHWWKQQLGEAYQRNYDGEPRTADPRRRFF